MISVCPSIVTIRDSSDFSRLATCPKTVRFSEQFSATGSEENVLSGYIDLVDHGFSDLRATHVAGRTRTANALIFFIVYTVTVQYRGSGNLDNERDL